MPDGLKVRTLENNAFCLSIDCAVKPADDAGNGDGIFLVGDDQIARMKLILLTVERRDSFSGAGPANHDAALKLVGIECMHRLRDSCHHVVRHIDNVADRVQAHCFEPCLQPERRRLHGDVFKYESAVPGQSSGLSTLTLIAAGPEGSSERSTRSRSGLRVIAETSRAIP